MSFLRKFNGLNFIILKRHFNQAAHSEIAWNDAKPFKQIPGPKSAFAFMPGGKYYKKPLVELFRLMRKDYGDIVTIPGAFGTQGFVAVYKPEDIEKVFRNEGKYPYRKNLETFEYYRKELRPDLFKAGGGLTVEQDHSWYEFRTKVNQIMMQPRNVKIYIPGIDEVAQDFVKKVRTIRDKSGEVPSNFLDTLNEYTLESIALIALDTRLNLLNESNEEAIDLYQRVKQVFEDSFTYDIQPSIWRFYKTPGFKRAMKNMDEVTKIIRRHVDKAVEKYENAPPTTDSHHEGVLEKLLKINRDVAIVMSADMLGAGIDTTASALAGILYSLAKNPDKQEKLREEVFNILPEKTSKFTEKSLENIPYMRAVIKEGMRLYPVINGNARRVTQDLVLCGYQIPSGNDILLNTAANYDFFGEPEKFIPERWLKDNHDPKCPHARDTHPFAFLPFGFGSRMCIGRRMAEMEIEILIARILREFKMEWNHPPLLYKSVAINLPNSPLKFKFTEI